MSEMREASPSQRTTIEHGQHAEALQNITAWHLVVEEIQKLRMSTLKSVLVGLPESEYRQKIGFISALDTVLGIPGELIERAYETGKSLGYHE